MLRTSLNSSKLLNSSENNAKEKVATLRLRWLRTVLLNLSSKTSNVRWKRWLSTIKTREVSVRPHISNSIKSLTNTGILNFSNLVKLTKTNLITWTLDTLKNSKTTAVPWKLNSPLPLRHLLNSLTSREFKLTWQSKRTIKKPIKSNAELVSSKLRKQKFMKKLDTRKSWLLSQSWCKSRLTKWLLTKRDLSSEWTKDWRKEKLSTTRFCRDTKMSRKRSRTSKTLRELRKSALTMCALVLLPVARWQALLRWVLLAWRTLRCNRTHLDTLLLPSLLTKCDRYLVLTKTT